MDDRIELHADIKYASLDLGGVDRERLDKYRL